jgi:hypothetical protein
MTGGNRLKYELERAMHFNTVSFGIIHRQWEQQKASNVVHIHNTLLPAKGMSILISQGPWYINSFI